MSDVGDRRFRTGQYGDRFGWSDQEADRIRTGRVVPGAKTTRRPRPAGAVAPGIGGRAFGSPGTMFGFEPSSWVRPGEAGPGGYPGSGDLDSYIRDNYGYFAAFMDNPEISKILYEAAKNKWSEAKLYGAITATGWWRNTDAANRTWQRLQSEDPAEARRLVNERVATLHNRAQAFGLNMSTAQLASLALTAERNQWNDDQVIDNLLGQVQWETLRAGDLTAVRDQVYDLAGDYLVQMSEETARAYAKRVASGELSIAGVESALQAQAKARWSWMADSIDQGTTPSMFFSGPRDLIARELEIAPEQIDLMDPKWIGIMEKQGDDGKPRAATLTEVQMEARQQPQWTNTANAKETTARMITMLGDVFGRKGI